MAIMKEEIMKGKLYLIPSPLSDSDLSSCFTEEIRTAVNQLRYFVVEDLRTARRYLSKLQLETPLDELNFELLNEHSNLNTVSTLLAPVFKGYDLGLLSDAGLPCIADPGEELVQVAHDNDITVKPLIGASSIFVALAASGLSGEKFSFEGYLPAKPPELIKCLKKLEQSSRLEKQSKIFIEAPYRNNKMFMNILNTCMPETQLCVACNLTASDEFIKTGRIKDWKKNVPDLNKKPCIFILQA